jgi:hypothetical protein
MPKQVTKHQCNYCIKSWVAKTRAVKHEAICFKNPATKSCATCNNFSKNEDYEPWCDNLSKVVMVKGSPILNCPRHEDIYEFEKDGE